MVGVIGTVAALGVWVSIIGAALALQPGESAARVRARYLDALGRVHEAVVTRRE